MFHVPDFEKVSIVVVGDLMLDRYWQGPASRISPEAPVQIVHVQSIEDRPGGAANVAVNLKSLGCDVHLLGVIGNDSAGEILFHKLTGLGINCRFEKIANYPTTTKLRVLGKNQQLIRLDFEENFPMDLGNVLMEQYQRSIQNADAIILSDYGKGVLKSSKAFINIAKKLNKPIYVDPKSTDFSVYQNATLITPNLKEFEAVVGPCRNENDIVSKGFNLIHTHNLDGLLITRGEDGMTLLQLNEEPLHLRAHASEVYDVSGAGDTVISVLAASRTAGCDFKIAATIANIAAGVVVRKLGVATVSVPELRRNLQRYHGSELGILQENELLISVADARAHGEKIVMTNGCFDILHPGHVAYLEEAKSLGDRLLVAVNDDSSVARLKGAQRPINGLLDRMKMLAALRSVDWVVAFSEDTPERLITQVKPDILVKASDYVPEQIAGASKVIDNGGQVKILKFIEGYSTSSLIEQIKGEIACT